MPRWSEMTNRWDQAALMRCPTLWQLRLHWYLPLALLWCLLVTGLWMPWMAESARWMGALPGTAAGRQTPEDMALEIGTVVAWIMSVGLALWWLLRVRIHNRWDERAPAGRWDLWREYLWGALFFSLLFTPALGFSPLYELRLQRQWSGTDISAQIKAVQQVKALETLVEPNRAAILVELVRVMREEQPRPSQTPVTQALDWLMRGDQAAMAEVLARYGQPLQAHGYVRLGASSAQEQAGLLLAAYRMALQSPLAREWHAYVAAHPRPKAGEQEAGTLDSSCRQAAHQGNFQDLRQDTGHCFAAYLAQSNRRWLDMLEICEMRAATERPLPHVQWEHARYGQALPGHQKSHLQRIDPSRGDGWRRANTLLATASIGFFAALALVLVRLMPAMQLVAWAAGMLMSLLLGMLAGMLGITHFYVMGLFPAGLLLAAWLRIHVLKRPWAGAVLLALGLSLAVMWLAAAWSEWSELLLPPTTGSDPHWTAAEHWLKLLLGAPAVAASTALLVALLSPLWRRWRGLPEQ